MSTQNGAAPTNGTAEKSTAIATQAAAATVELDATGEIVRVGFDTLQGFRTLQRIAQAFSVSDLVPEAYHGKLANCVIAVEMAMRMGASPLMVMQNLYLVHGRPAWSSQFLIASFNNCGRFSAIKYRWSGEKGKPSWGCVAWAREKDTGEIVEGPEVTLAMAKSEGWIDKKGSKWLTIPQLMLTYRSATFLVRTTAPELTMGLRTADEQEDIGPVGDEILPLTTAPTQVDPARAAAPAADATAATEQPQETAREAAPAQDKPTTEQEQVLAYIAAQDTPQGFKNALDGIVGQPKEAQQEMRIALIRQIDLHIEKGNKPTPDLGKLAFRIVAGLEGEALEAGKKFYGRHNWKGA